TMNQSLTRICHDFSADLIKAVGNHPASDIFVLTDEQSYRHCYPLIATEACLKGSHLITIPAGDVHKTIESAVEVWKYLSEHAATRRSLMMNLGGGMVTDLGGFVASTFKRGIRYINLSTALLGAVDAATGGKTGINFLGYKN